MTRGWLLAVVLALCAPGVARLRPLRSRALTRIVRAAVDAREARRRARLPLPVLPNAGAAWVAGREPDGTQHVVLGPMRVDLRAGLAVAADDRPAEAIIAAVPGYGTWLFASADGTVARAETFTGRLRVIGAMPCGALAVQATVGRLVMRDPTGAWWSTDGSGAPAPLRVPGRAMAVAFAGRQRGAAVLEGGSLVVTHDGGASWRVAGGGSDVAWEVAGDALGLSVAGGLGIQVITADDRLSPVGDPPSPRPVVERDQNAVAAAALRRTDVLPAHRCDAMPRDSSAGGGLQWSIGTGEFDCSEGGSHAARLTPSVGSLLPGEDHRSMGPVAGLRAHGVARDRVTLVWRGEDAEGTYARVARGALLPCPPGPDQDARSDGGDPSETHPQGGGLTLVAASRAGALVRCTDQTAARYWVPVTGPVVLVPDTLFPGLRGGDPPLYVPLADGSLVESVALAPATHWPQDRRLGACSEPVAIFAAQQIGPDGSVVARRTLALPVRPGAIAVYQGTWWIAVQRIDDPGTMRLFPPGDGTPVDLSGPQGASGLPCEGAPAPGSVMLWQPSSTLWFSSAAAVDFEGDQGPYMSGASAVWETSLRGTCLRHVEATADSFRYVRLSARPGGVLAGAGDDGLTVRRVRCRYVPERPSDPAE